MKKRVLPVALALLMVAPAAWAGAKPQPYKSAEGTIALSHPIFYGNTGTVNNVTAKEFEQTCAIPASNGVDSYVFAVPKPYQKVTAIVDAIGTDTGPAGYDLDMYFYDKTCKNNGASNVAGVDEEGLLPKGTAYVLVDNYLGDPNVSAHIELRMP
ncbi:MAG: hypothetical protein ABR579_02145 [Actinomycetota bacterium]